MKKRKSGVFGDARGREPPAKGRRGEYLRKGLAKCLNQPKWKVHDLYTFPF
ncbi:MAG: hypothetical protein IJZ13_06460 [Clostridia bacterium]|nr:hypothetical protein [Clostridia bacterium]